MIKDQRRGKSFPVVSPASAVFALWTFGFAHCLLFYRNKFSSKLRLPVWKTCFQIDVALSFFFLNAITFIYFEIHSSVNGSLPAKSQKSCL